MAKYQIKIEKGNRKQIFVEQADIIVKDNQAENNPLFHEEYLKAKKILDSFTKDISSNENEDSKSDDKKSKDHKNYGYKNNIIVFTGDRGTGKTSAMVSFGEYLKEKGIKTSDNNDEKAAGCKLLDMIDPSYFRKNESILLNVITMMFKMAKEHNEKCNSKYREDCDKYKDENSSGFDFNKLLAEFEKVFRSVKRMDSTVPQEDSLEYLNELSDALDLNKSIHELIDNFLKFFRGKLKYLVLMIDDLDMNVAYAATMLEQIRKFLIQDNVIILIATNVGQLQFEMKEYYSKYYVKTLHPAQQNVSVSIDVEDMATKYLLKLFPPLQRIHISDAANKLIDTKLIVEGLEKGKHDFNDDLQKVILNLIWKKTRLIFIPEKEQLHPIIPTNLRALHQLVYILLNMDDLSKDNSDKLFKDKEDYEKAHINFKKFKDYILNVWIPSNVSFEEQKVFDNIPKDISRINKHLIQSINIIGSKYKKSILAKEIDSKELFKDDDEKIKFDRDIYTFVSPNDPKFSHANKISDVINFPSNNAAGDILLLIDKYKTYFEAANQNNFIEAIKIYYSLLLFETMFFRNTPSINIKDVKITATVKIVIKIKDEEDNKEEVFDIEDKNITVQVRKICLNDKGISVEGKTISLKGDEITICVEKKNITAEGIEVKEKGTKKPLKNVYILGEKISINGEISKNQDGKTIILNGKDFTVNIKKAEIEEVKDISNIQELIGGTLFFPHYFTIIKSSKYEELKEIKREDDNLIKKLEDLLLKYSENIQENNSNQLKKDVERIFAKAGNTIFKVRIEKAIGSKPTILKIQNEIDKKNTLFRINTKINNLQKANDNNNENEIKRILNSLIDEPVSNLCKEEIRERLDSLAPNLDKIPNIISRLNSEFLIGKSEPSENHLFYHSFNEFKVDSLFYIVYYGRKRPERSYGIQIYDTKAADLASGDNYKYRFDILSLLANTLNPYQTLARFEYNNSEISTEEKTTLNSLKRKVEAWNTFNMVDNKFLQNSILPIYSVDLMLKYLKEQFDANDIDTNFNSDLEKIEDTKKMERHVRGPEFIFKYYEKLKELTETELSKIEPCEDKKISTIYNAIYNKGCECFIPLTPPSK